MEQKDRRVVLIAEDSEPIAELLEEVLNDEPDIRAVAVFDGAEALETASRVRTDLLLLDVRMPRLNGIEVYDRLRADRVAAPVLFITANQQEFAEDFARRGVAADVIAKPFDVNEVVARVRSLLATSDQRSAAGDESPAHAG